MRLEMTNNKNSGTRCGCDLSDDICSEEMERCVLCWRLTDVPETRPVSQRNGYIEGAGQLWAKVATAHFCRVVFCPPQLFIK